MDGVFLANVLRGMSGLELVGWLRTPQDDHYGGMDVWVTGQKQGRVGQLVSWPVAALGKD